MTDFHYKSGHLNWNPQRCGTQWRACAGGWWRKSGSDRVARSVQWVVSVRRRVSSDTRRYWWCNAYCTFNGHFFLLKIQRLWRIPPKDDDFLLKNGHLLYNWQQMALVAVV